MNDNVKYPLAGKLEDRDNDEGALRAARGAPLQVAA